MWREGEGCFDKLSTAPHPGGGYDRRVDLSLREAPRGAPEGDGMVTNPFLG